MMDHDPPDAPSEEPFSARNFVIALVTVCGLGVTFALLFGLL
jgi:hypothetical protein